MTDKAKFAEIFNKLLDTDIPWERLPKESLIELAVLFNHPEILMKKLGGNEKAKVVLGEVALGLMESFDGPVAKMLRRVVSRDPPDSSPP
jgi:hypothetical protein